MFVFKNKSNEKKFLKLRWTCVEKQSNNKLSHTLKKTAAQRSSSTSVIGKNWPQMPFHLIVICKVDRIN